MEEQYYKILFKKNTINIWRSQSVILAWRQKIKRYFGSTKWLNKVNTTEFMETSGAEQCPKIWVNNKVRETYFRREQLVGWI